MKQPVRRAFLDFSPESAFFRDSRRRRLILRSLQKQGISEAVLLAEPEESDLAGTETVDGIRLLAGEERKQSTGAELPDQCLIIQDEYSLSLNLDILNTMDQSKIACSTSLIRDQGECSQNSIIFDHNGRVISDQGRVGQYRYSGAFVCSSEVFRAVYEPGRQSFCLGGSDELSQDRLLGVAMDSRRDFYRPEGPDAAVDWLGLSYSPCLFLDRDGILNEDTGYPHNPDELIFLESSVGLIQWARKRNYRVVVLTNQAGIAKGKFALSDLERFHQKLIQHLEAFDAAPDEIFYCPYHPDGQVAGYALSSPDRKPAPGMALRSMETFPTKLKGSLMVGDRPSDQLRLPGLETFLIQGRYPLDQARCPVFSDMSALTEFLTQRNELNP